MNSALTPAQYRTFKLPDAQKQRLTAQHAKLREQQQELILQQSRAKTPANQAKLVQQAQRIAQMINKISQQLVQCKLAEEYEAAQNKSMTGPSLTVSQPVLTQAAAAAAALNKAKALKTEIPGTSAPTSIATTPVASVAPTPGASPAAAASVVAAAATNAALLASSSTAAVKPTITIPKEEIPSVDMSAAVADGVPSMPTPVEPLTPQESPKIKLDENFKSVVPDLTGLGASEKLLTAVAAYEKHKPEVLKRAASRFSRVAIAIGAKLNTSYVAT